MTRIAIVDDHELLAQSLRFSLQAQGFEATAHPVTDLAATLDEVLTVSPEVVLLDLQLGAAGHGSSLIRPLVAAGARVLVVTGVTDECEIAATLEMGAVGYVSKNRPIEVLLDCAARVARGERVLSDAERYRLLMQLRNARVEELARHAPFERLTAREREVLRGLAAGRPVTVIADECFVSVATVRTQVRAILAKLEVGSQLEAVALAHRHGWYDAQPAAYQHTA